jgi:hypothetical protein
MAKSLFVKYASLLFSPVTRSGRDYDTSKQNSMPSLLTLELENCLKKSTGLNLTLSYLN